MVEGILSHTGPTKVFTTTVMASIAGLAVKGSGVAAAGVYGVLSSTGTSTVLTGLTAKAVAVAAALAIGVGAVSVYWPSRNQSSSMDPAPAESAFLKQQIEPNVDEGVASGELSENSRPLGRIEAPRDESIPNAEAPRAAPPPPPKMAREEPSAPRVTKKPSVAYEFHARGVLSGV